MLFNCIFWIFQSEKLDISIPYWLFIYLEGWILKPQNTLGNNILWHYWECVFFCFFFFPKCVYCHIWYQYLTGLQIFAHSPKKEKYFLKLLSSINYASHSTLHKSFTHREKENNNETDINVEYLVTYKLFLQH